jgi:L-iditol 2-dehydrogenase
MKAVVKTQPEPGNVHYIEVTEPCAGPGQVLIEIKNAGVCGTDIHIFKSEYVIKPPVILGHEVCGTIVETGPGVKRWRTGDRVTVNPSAGRLCGVCRFCRLGAPFLCVDRAAVGSGMNGGFAKHLAVREEIVFPLPETLDFETGALCEPFACAVQAVLELTTIRAGEVVAVSGPGPVGLMCAMIAKAHGARVVLIGTTEDAARLELGRSIGADLALRVEDGNVLDAVRELTHGYGADVVLECSGAHASAALCLELVRKMGSYTQVGIFGSPFQVDLDKVVLKQLRMQGSICHSWQTWDTTLRLLGDGIFNLRPLISNRLPLSRWEDAFQGVIRGTETKVLLYPE